MFKKFAEFFGCFGSVVGLIGGIGYTIFYDGWPVSLCIAILGFAAFPRVKGWFKDLRDA